MSTTTYLNRFLAPVAEVMTPELAQAVAGIRVDAELQSYVDTMAAKASAGELTDEETAEYQSLIDAADIIAILQMKARQRLTQSPPLRTI